MTKSPQDVFGFSPRLQSANAALSREAPRGRIRRLWGGLFLAAFFCAPVAGAQQCHETALSVLARSVEGHRIPMANLSHCRTTTLERPQPGSGNIPILIEAACYRSGACDGTTMLPFLLGGSQWSHNGRENGSPIYEHWNAAAVLALLHKAQSPPREDRTNREQRTDRGEGAAAGAPAAGAPAAGAPAAAGPARDPHLAVAASRWLRAYFAKLALASTPRAPRQMVFLQGAQTFRRPRVDHIRYRGPFAHLVGERAGGKPSGKFTGRWAELSSSHPLLAWAADWPGRAYSAKYIGPSSLTMALWVVTRSAPGEPHAYTDSVPPRRFGLTPDERRTLRAFLENPADPDLARRVAQWLDGYPQRRGVVTLFRRTVAGDVDTLLSRSSNGNKPGAVAVGSRGGLSRWIVPSPYKGVGAASAEAFLRGDGRIVTRSSSGNKIEIPAAPGPVAWTVRWTDRGAEFRVGGRQVPGSSP